MAFLPQDAGKPAMKGDPCFGKKNQSVRPVFRAVGSLLCWRLQSEWEGQKNFSGSGSISENLLATLPSWPEDGSPPGRSWSRWRSYSSGDSAFAAGSLEIAGQVLDRAVELNLLEEELATDTQNFFKLLGKLGYGQFSIDDDQLEDGLSQGYSIVFDLAGIEPGSKDDIFLNLKSNIEFSRESFQKNFKVNVAEAGSHAIDSAFAALTALGRLEKAIKGAHDVLEGEKPGNEADLGLVRELVMAFYASEGASLVRAIHASMKLTHKPGGNLKELVKLAMKPLLNAMSTEVKEL